MKNRILKVNLRVVAVPKLSRDCRDHCCPGEHRLELWAALDAHGDIHKHVLNSPIENAIPWFLGSWHKGLLLRAGKAPKGSRAVQVTQLCPKVQEQGQTHSIYSSSLLPRVHWRPWKAEHKPQQAQENLSSHARAAAPFPALQRLNAASRRWHWR